MRDYPYASTSRHPSPRRPASRLSVRRLIFVVCVLAAAAIGHPFAATGGRIVGSLANTLRRTGQRYGLISICAAGGMGGVMILENVNHGN